VLSVQSKKETAESKIGQVAADVAAAPTKELKDNAANDVQAAQEAVSAIKAILTKAVGGDIDANNQVIAKQLVLASSLKRSWAWAKLAADPTIVPGTLEDPFKHPYWETFKQRMTVLKAAGHIDVDPMPFAATIWEKLCKAVKAAAPAMKDPDIFQKENKARIDMASAPFKKAVSEFDALGKEIAKAATSQFKIKQTFGFWSSPEGRAMSEGMNELTLETSSIGGILDGLPTLDGKKMGWDPELWGALSKAYAEAMIPQLVKKGSTKRVNVCIGAGAQPGNVWEVVESEALKLGLEQAGKTLSDVATFWGAAALSRDDRSKLDVSKNQHGYSGAVYSGKERDKAIAAAEAHFKALPAAGAKPKPPEQLSLLPDPAAVKPATPPAPPPPAAPGAPGPQPASTPSPTAALSATPTPTAPVPPTTQPMVTSATAAPATAPVTPATAPVMPVPAPATVAEPAKQPEQLPLKGLGCITIPERRAQGGKIPDYIKPEKEDEYWFNTNNSKYERRDGKRQPTEHDVQVKAYWEIVKKLSLTAELDAYKKYDEKDPKSVVNDPNAPEIKNGDAEAFRHALVAAVLAKYGKGTRDDMDKNVFSKNAFAGSNHQGIQGEIFNKWVLAAGLGYKKHKVKWVLKAPDGTARGIESDGVIEGEDTFLECKAHSLNDTETAADVHVDVEQMEDYKRVLGEIDTERMGHYKALINVEGFYVNDAGEEKRTVFLKVKYELNNARVAEAYEKKLIEKGMQGKYILNPLPAKKAAGAPKEYPKPGPELKPPPPPAPPAAPPPPAAPTVSPATSPTSSPTASPTASPTTQMAAPQTSPGAQPSAQPPAEPQPPAAPPQSESPGEKKPDEPKGDPYAARVPMTVNKESHSQFVDKSTKKPMVASTPTPVTDKLAELAVKIEALPATDPRKAVAEAEAANARVLEKNLADLAAKAALTPPLATPADVEAAQRALAPSIAKIWAIAEPAAMDLAGAKAAIDATAPECNDISDPYAPEWDGKKRSDFEAEFIDKNKLRHNVISKYLGTAPDKAKIRIVGSKDPIAVQKFADIDNEAHLVDPGLKDEFYKELHPHLIKPAYIDRTRTYPVMKAACDRTKYVCKGTPIDPATVGRFSSRNHSIDRMFDKRTSSATDAINKHIERELKKQGALAADIAIAQGVQENQKRAYRHILATHGEPHKTVEPSATLNPYGAAGEMWYSPGEITTTKGISNSEFAKMMTLGALQPEWYPQGTCVLKIDAALSTRTRQIYRPTAFDGLMSALWTARNNTGEVFGLTGGGAAEFLETGVTYAQVSSSKTVVPTDDFIKEMARIATEVKAKAPTSSSTEELLRGKDTGKPKGEVNVAMNQVVERTKQEQSAPSAMPASAVSPGAAPPIPAVAAGGAMDKTNGPTPEGPLTPAAPPTATSNLPGKPAEVAPGATPGPTPEQGGLQKNDARSPEQTAAGATAKPEFGGDGTKSVAEVAKEKHGDQERDSHFNPVEKVKFEKALALALLANAQLYEEQVNQVSAKILEYFEARLTRGITNGLKQAHDQYERDLAELTKASKPGWWGAVEIEAGATNKDIAGKTRTSLMKGTLPQKLAVHQNFIEILKPDWESGVMKAILAAAAVSPWKVRQETKLKNGQLDPTGTTVFKGETPSPEDDANEAERGRTGRGDKKAVSDAGPGVEARGATGAAPASQLPTVIEAETLPAPGDDMKEAAAKKDLAANAGTSEQKVYRGLDSFTMDESKAFCQYARLHLNLPLVAGVSGSTAELINVAMAMGLAGGGLDKYALAVLAFVAGGGNHSFLEIAIVLKAAGVNIDHETYAGVAPLIGAKLFEELKSQHPNAFKTSPGTSTPTPTPTPPTP